MKLERQMAWPCHDCSVRDTSVCNVLIGRAPVQPMPAKQVFSQAFIKAEKDEVISQDESKGTAGPYVLCQGWALRQFCFSDGRRQILSVLIPGDPFFTAESAQSGLSVQAATDIQFCELRRDDIRREMMSNPVMSDAFGSVHAQAGNESVATALNLREPDPVRRIMTFVQRIVGRLAARGFGDGKTYPFPLAPADIADALALSTDDVNRAIEALRAECIFDLSNGTVAVLHSMHIETRLSAESIHDATRANASPEIRL